MTILKQLNDFQKQTIHEAAAAVQQAEDRAEGLRRFYDRLIGMALPEGATGFDLQAGVFYREEVDSIEVPADGPQLVTDDEGPGSEEE